MGQYLKNPVKKLFCVQNSSILSLKKILVGSVFPATTKKVRSPNSLESPIQPQRNTPENPTIQKLQKFSVPFLKFLIQFQHFHQVFVGLSSQKDKKKIESRCQDENK
jgi:hypothetical protein